MNNRVDKWNNALVEKWNKSPAHINKRYVPREFMMYHSYFERLEVKEEFTKEVCFSLGVGYAKESYTN